MIESKMIRTFQLASALIGLRKRHHGCTNTELVSFAPQKLTCRRRSMSVLALKRTHTCRDCHHCKYCDGGGDTRQGQTYAAQGNLVRHG
jgi:hypothetical protein